MLYRSCPGVDKSWLEKVIDFCKCQLHPCIYVCHIHPADVTCLHLTHLPKICANLPRLSTCLWSDICVIITFNKNNTSYESEIFIYAFGVFVGPFLRSLFLCQPPQQSIETTLLDISVGNIMRADVESWNPPNYKWCVLWRIAVFLSIFCWCSHRWRGKC